MFGKSNGAVRGKHFQKVSQCHDAKKRNRVLAQRYLRIFYFLNEGRNFIGHFIGKDQKLRITRHFPRLGLGKLGVAPESASKKRTGWRKRNFRMTAIFLSLVFILHFPKVQPQEELFQYYFFTPLEKEIASSGFSNIFFPFLFLNIFHEHRHLVGLRKFHSKLFQTALSLLLMALCFHYAA